ncbi:MAG: hypothetical protein MZW92_30410 [Comamonadaceae bacterium]|nr:hypothetical protein [Comamonadaceae bacterium]
MRRERRLQRMAQAMGLPGCDADGTEVADAIARDERPPGPARAAWRRWASARTCSSASIDGAMADHCHKTNPRHRPRATTTGRCSTSSM